MSRAGQPSLTAPITSTTQHSAINCGPPRNTKASSGPRPATETAVSAAAAASSTAQASRDGRGKSAGGWNSRRTAPNRAWATARPAPAAISRARTGVAT